MQTVLEPDNIRAWHPVQQQPADTFHSLDKNNYIPQTFVSLRTVFRSITWNVLIEHKRNTGWTKKPSSNQPKPRRAQSALNNESTQLMPREITILACTRLSCTHSDETGLSVSSLNKKQIMWESRQTPCTFPVDLYKTFTHGNMPPWFMQFVFENKPVTNAGK